MLFNFFNRDGCKTLDSAALINAAHVKLRKGPQGKENYNIALQFYREDPKKTA
jgi:hypothetical protein